MKFSHNQKGCFTKDAFYSQEIMTKILVISVGIKLKYSTARTIPIGLRLYDYSYN